MHPEAQLAVLEEIEQLRISNTVIIVEGKKDKAALQLFGITNILELSKQSLAALIDNLAAEKECIILTDLDKEGRKLYGRLSQGLEKRGVRLNKKFRNFLYTQTKLRNIEGLKHYHE